MTDARRPHIVSAHRASRSTAPGHDLFPTPPWATRALMAHPVWRGMLLLRDGNVWPVVWEPAAGRGHMAAVLSEQYVVYTSDIERHEGWLHTEPLDAVGSFTGMFRIGAPTRVALDAIVTNPPYGDRLIDFIARALEFRVPVALLVRTVALEGLERWQRVFSRTPPAVVLQFAERVPMVAGRFDPDATTATAYQWWLWDGRRRALPADTSTLLWFAPGQRQKHTRPDDAARFGDAMTPDDPADAPPPGLFAAEGGA